MNKIFAIGIKDLQLILKDRAALILMLAAPFLITLGMGFVAGAFEEDSGNGGISDIPLMIINRDTGSLGGQLELLFASNDLSELIQVVAPQPETVARQLVNADELAALIIIPADFSDTLFPDYETGETVSGKQLEIYRSPSRPVSVSVIETIVDRFLSEVNGNTILVQVTIDQLLASGEIDPAVISEQVGRLLPVPENAQTAITQTRSLITINQNSGAAAGSTDNDFNALTILAPGMALFFLMYTVTLGGRSILQERHDGTLARMQTSATSSSQILAGKIFGIFLTAVAQVGVLIIGSSLLYNLHWGDWFGLIALIASAALAATGWGLLFASAVKTPEQVAGIGSAVMILFGAISGTFTQIDNPFVKGFGSITPNQWALQGFTKLGLGQSIVDILPNIGALWLMALILFAVSAVLFQRQIHN